MDSTADGQQIAKAPATSGSEHVHGNQGVQGSEKSTNQDPAKLKATKTSKKKPQGQKKKVTSDAPPSKSKPGRSKSPAATSAQETINSPKTNSKKSKPAKRNVEGKGDPKQAVKQKTDPQIPIVDMSSISVGSANQIVQELYTEPVTSSTVVGTAKAPDVVYRLGDPAVSIESAPRPIENPTKMSSQILSIGKGPIKGRVIDVFGRVPQIGKGKAKDPNAGSSKGKAVEVSHSNKNLSASVSKNKTPAPTAKFASLTPNAFPSVIKDNVLSAMGHGKRVEKIKKSQSKTRDTDKPKSVKEGEVKDKKYKDSKRFRQEKPENLKPQPAGLIQPPPLPLQKEPIPIDANMLCSLEKLVHPDAQLRAYGYTTSNPTAEEIQAALAKVGDDLKCRRCEKTFVYKEVAWNRISEDACVHHPGRCSVEVLGKKLKSGKPMKVWSCCSRRGFAPACATAPTHVVEMEDAGRLAALCPFEATPASSDTTNKVSKIQKVIAIDCEMSYTKHGLTLSRLSILSFPDCRVLENTYIREPYPGIHFLDYNTRYSGVTHENLYPEDPDNSPPVLDGIIAARNKIWEYCDENTIVIGHGLDHDFKCLRMLHPKIIDTAILFSKVEGQKSRLKKLAEEQLKWCIQDDVGNPTGHDSVEDCRTCIELVLKFLQRPVIPAESAASEVPD